MIPFPGLLSPAYSSPAYILFSLQCCMRCSISSRHDHAFSIAFTTSSGKSSFYISDIYSTLDTPEIPPSAESSFEWCWIHSSAAFPWLNTDAISIFSIRAGSNGEHICMHEGDRAWGLESMEIGARTHEQGCRYVEGCCQWVDIEGRVTVWIVGF